MSSTPGLSASPSWRTDLDDDSTACKYAGEFFASWMTTPEQLKAQSYRGAGIYVTAGYIRALQNVDQQTASDGQILEWFADTQDQAQASSPEDYQKFLDTIIKPALDNCGASVCRSLGWTGNGDLAGVGIFASYYIEAVLATIFFVFLLLCHRKKWESTEQPYSQKPFSQRILDAFLGAANDFGATVFLFSLAVLVASLKSIIDAQNDPLSITTYEITTAILVSVFSMCPATLLYSMGVYGKGPRWLQLIFLFVLWVLMLAVVNLGTKTNPSKTLLDTGSIGNPFEVFCPVIDDNYLDAIRIAALVLTGLGVLWILYLALYKCLGWQVNKESKRSIIRRQWRVGFSLLALVAMWIFLAVFTVLRARSIEVAGDSDKSNEWSFGQVIAITAWAPVLINFFYVLFFGDRKISRIERTEGGVDEKA